MSRDCAIYRTPLGCYENLIRPDLFIYSSRRSELLFLLIQWSENDNCLACKVWEGSA